MGYASINKCDTQRWKQDVRESVLLYNDWFVRFAPAAYRGARASSIDSVVEAFEKSGYFRDISVELLKEAPQILAILRMATMPPLARDRLAGLSDVPNALIKKLESGEIPAKHINSLEKIIKVIRQLLDKDLMPWLAGKGRPSRDDLTIAKAIIGDRICGSIADPHIRNAQERRQLEKIGDFLRRRLYRFVKPKDVKDIRSMQPGTFSYHLNVPVKVGSSAKVNITADVVIMRKNASKGSLPIFIECKSAGDFTNTNKRRKEEAVKMAQLTDTYGKGVEFVLFLCGYFDSGYLGYEAAEGIDWVWEHRIEDLEKAGV